MPRPPEGTVRRAMAARTRTPVADLLAEVAQIVELPLAAIAPNPTQPRRTQEPAALAELAASIERHGLLQPIVVRRHPAAGAAANAPGAPAQSGTAYELIAGSRRLAAHATLGRARITAVVLAEGEPETLAIVENLQREGLTPLDEARALAALKDRHGYTLEILGALVGRSVSYLSEIMSLRHLPPTILAQLEAGQGPAMPRASLVELARIKDPSAQMAAFARLKGGDGTRRELRAARRPPARPAGSAAGPASNRALAREAVRLCRRLTDDPPALDGDPDLRAALIRLRVRVEALLGYGGRGGPD